MPFQNLRDRLVHLLTSNERQAEQTESQSVLTEQARLIHRLNSIHLNDDESKCLQGYLTSILEARTQDKTSDFAPIAQPGCIVLEMSEEEYQNFTSHIGGNSTHMFRAIADSGKGRALARKLMVVGENGMRLFQVVVQRDSKSVRTI